MSGTTAVNTAATKPSGTPGAGTLSPTGGAGAAAGPWGMAAEAGLGIGMSLYQASEQAAAARNFAGQQAKAIEEAKRQAGANFMKNVGVPLTGELEGMKANTAAYKQALEAGTEGDVRNLQGLVGRVNESNVDANAQQANRIDENLYKLHMAQAQEQKDSANALAGISLNEAEGAGLAKQQAEKAKIAAYTSAAQSGLRIGAGLDQMRALYPNQKNSNQVSGLQTMGTNQTVSGTAMPGSTPMIVQDNPAITNNGMGFGAQAETASPYNWNLFNR